MNLFDYELRNAPYIFVNKGLQNTNNKKKVGEQCK